MEKVFGKKFEKEELKKDIDKDKFGIILFEVEKKFKEVVKLVKFKLKNDKLKFVIELLLGKDFYFLRKLNESVELRESIYDDVVKLLFKFEFFVFVFENKVVKELVNLK